MTFGYLLCIMILVLGELLCAMWFFGVGLFSFVGVIVTVILISIFTFGAPSVSLTSSQYSMYGISVWFEPILPHQNKEIRTFSLWGMGSGFLFLLGTLHIDTCVL